jgi:hypothetical protein
MRNLAVILALVLCAGNLWAGQRDAPSAPQTARQALMEMFFSKESGTFAKHLPAPTRAVLEKSGALANLQQYSMLASQFQSQGKNLQTFETGSVLLTMDNHDSGQKVEVTVENDALQGDQDDIELSFQTYKNGQLERTPFLPRVTFSMKSEAGIWKLYEISLTVHLPLADPDLLKTITNSMKARAVASSQIQPAAQGSTQTFGSDAQVVTAMRTILTAELTYANTYRATGFNCTLSDLDGFGGGEANEHQAMLINSGLASGKRYGYVFTLSGCMGAPAQRFHLTAAPSGNSYGRRAFCADQSGLIRTSSDGNAATCVASGVPMQ